MRGFDVAELGQVTSHFGSMQISGRIQGSAIAAIRCRGCVEADALVPRLGQLCLHLCFEFDPAMHQSFAYCGDIETVQKGHL